MNTEIALDIIETGPLVLNPCRENWKSCHLDILERNIAFFPGQAKSCILVLIVELLGNAGA